MKIYLFIFSLFSTHFVLAEEVLKPQLQIYAYENPSAEAFIDVLFMSEFQSGEPATLPHARALGITEMFVQSAAIQGHDLLAFYKETDQSRQIEDHVSQLGNAIKMRFILSVAKTEALGNLLSDIKKMPAQVGCITDTVHEETKLSLASILPFFEKPAIVMSSEQLQDDLYDTIPIPLLNSFMKGVFPLTANYLIVSYPQGASFIKSFIMQKIEELKEDWLVENHDTMPTKNSIAKKSIVHNAQDAIIDGKIYMDSPKWWQKESNVRPIGIGLVVAGLLLCIFTFGISVLTLTIPAGLLIAHASLNDPSAIEKRRHEVLQSGAPFDYAYNKHWLDITLTPHERRQFFVQCIFERNLKDVKEISDFTAYYAIKKYHYYTPEIKEFLYKEELHQLVRYQSEYYQDIEDNEKIKRDLKEELALALQPYRKLRDIGIESAHCEYNTCTAVLLQATYLAEYEKEKKFAYSECNQGEITFDEYNKRLRYLNEQYDNNIKSLKPFLQMAEAHLENRIHEIKVQYKLNITYCKNSINYEPRMQALEAQEWLIMASYSDLMACYIMENINPEDTSFPDFLDLRMKNKGDISLSQI